MTPEDAADRIDRYCAAWSAQPAETRRTALAALLAPDVRYTDPTVDLTGIEALAAHIESVVARRPGATVLRTSAVDLHHRTARFAWHIRDGARLLMDGSIDVVEFAPDGRIARILGFFHAPAPRVP